MTAIVTCLVDAACLLAEGPVWDDRAQHLYWVDIKLHAIHRFDPGSGDHRRWPAPEQVSALAVREQGGLVVALQGGFAFFDPDTGGFARLLNPQPERPGARLNDAKCDRRGRFWVGGMDDAEQDPVGDLFRLDPDLTCQRFTIGYVVTNGIGWSSDGETFYFNDSAERRAYAYDFDMESGRLGARRLFTVFAEHEGHPDGLCVDADDHVWIAHWDGGRVSRHRPDGSLAAVVELPAVRTTSCCFGGPDLDILYVTTARVGLDAAALRAQPQSGAVFTVTGTGAKGRPMNRFAG